MRLEPLIAKKFEMKGSEKSRQSLLDRDMEIKLAENIRALRKQLSLTQEQLAEAMEISTGAVSKWEQGGSLR